MKKQEAATTVAEKAEEVIALMKQGWGLAKSAITQNYWLQLGGCGNGGPSKNLGEDVVDYLVAQGAIKAVLVKPGQRQAYKLKDAHQPDGETAQEEAA